MNKTVMICTYLKGEHNGKDKAVHSRELERLFSIDSRSLQRVVQYLRKQGHPICSSEAGYFYAETQQEIIETVRRMNALMRSISKTCNSLLSASASSLEPPVLNININLK